MTDIPLRLFYISLIFCVTCFGAAFIFHDSLVPALVTILVGGFWIFSRWRKWLWGDLFGLFLFMLLLAFGAWQSVGAPYLLAGVALILSTWDLSQLSLQFERVEHIDHWEDILRIRLVRLGVVLLIGVSLSILALSLQTNFSFGWGLILGAGMIWALGKVIANLREN
jgi:hypothetical protein